MEATDPREDGGGDEEEDADRPHEESGELRRFLVVRTGTRRGSFAQSHFF